MDNNGQSNCFITLKDQKQTFQNNPSVRLINPAKMNSEGRVNIIQAMSKGLRHKKINLNQWKNIEDIIDWFRSINKKQL